ncbi:MAG: hypothetical protein KC609_13935 [Myxococcales bacterium]|nr:hypothetical protein [Myxococcales bacterium]
MLLVLALVVVLGGCSAGSRGESDQAGHGDATLGDLVVADVDASMPHDTDLWVPDDLFDASESDATESDGVSGDANADGTTTNDGSDDSTAPVSCSVAGVAGSCIDVSECAALGGHSSTPGYCPGPTEIQCCTASPSVSDNPPLPAGWKLMSQAAVTPEMTAWAIEILHDPATYPMFSTTTKTFGTLTVLARVEWHPPDFQNNKVHRGVTLYVPI